FLLSVCFFFSSRRRHTRSKRDWSSDVCSSDLDLDLIKKKRHAIVVISEKITDVHQFAKKVSLNTGFSGRATILGHVQRGGAPTRSEERRVGKERGARCTTEL